MPFENRQDFDVIFSQPINQIVVLRGGEQNARRLSVYSPNFVSVKPILKNH